VIELKKCDNELCDRAVKTWTAYCCEACAQAHEGHYEIHEDGPLGHRPTCEERHAERGPYCDPWAPPSLPEEFQAWQARPNAGPPSQIRWVGP
jgi:hypothetical protein